MAYRIIDADAFIKSPDTGLAVQINGKVYPLLNVNVLQDYISYMEMMEKDKKSGKEIKLSEVKEIAAKPYEFLHQLVPDCPMEELRKFTVPKAIALAGHLIMLLCSEAGDLEAKSPGRLGGTEEKNEPESGEAEKKKPNGISAGRS